jgi:hypothetical protein
LLQLRHSWRLGVEHLGAQPLLGRVETLRLDVGDNAADPKALVRLPGDAVLTHPGLPLGGRPW